MHPISKDFARFLQAEYDHGYTIGCAGLPYDGRTFIGYYGWLDGIEAYKTTLPSEG